KEKSEKKNKKGKQGSFIWILDKTVKAMGSRKLKKWIERPLLFAGQIEERLNIVEGMYNGFMERDTLRDALKSVYDLERLAGRIAFGNVNARDLIQLKNYLKQIPLLIDVLKQFEQPENGR